MSATKKELFDEIFAEDHNYYVARWTKPLEFISRDSKNLLVTIGDNWTRGFDFGKRLSGVPHPTVDARFGEIVSEQLGWDFLNLAIPAIPNLWMAQKYQQICENYNSLGYERIKVFITFTEYGREFSSIIDDQFPELLEKYKTCTTTAGVLQTISDHIAEMLTIDTEVELSVSLAYTSNLYPSSLNFLPMSWLEVLKNQHVTDPCLMLLDQSIDTLKDLPQINSTVDLTQLNNELDQLYVSAANLRKMINDTGYTLDPELCWPNAAAHALWAQYILDNVTF